MIILITGGAGFIGLNLSARLLRLGHEVTSLDNYITSDKNNISALKNEPGFKFFETDIINPLPNHVVKVKFDRIYHLACPTGVPNLTVLDSEMALTCSLGTLNILELAKKNGSRLLFTSSSEIYGNPLISPQTENYTGNVDPVGIRAPYEEGKRFAETLVKIYYRKYNLQAKIVRIFNTYGPYMAAGDTRVIPLFFTRCLNGMSLPLHGDGNQKRTFLYIDDLIEGLLTVMEKGGAGEVYNLGNHHSVTIFHLAEKILKLTGNTAGLEKTDRPPHDHQTRMPDLTRISRLGWQPSVSLDEGLQKTFLWLQKQVKT